MDRRALLQWLSTSAALAFVPSGASLFEAGRAVHRSAAVARPGLLGIRRTEFVTLLGDRILPRTDTPGASDVNATAFVDRLLSDWYPDDERARFLAGLDQIAVRAVAEHQRPLEELDPARQMAFLTALDGQTGELDTAAGAFGRLKGLVVYAYFTSELVHDQVTHTPIIPGRFDGCTPLPSQ